METNRASLEEKAAKLLQQAEQHKQTLNKAKELIAFADDIMPRWRSKNRAQGIVYLRYILVKALQSLSLTVLEISILTGIDRGCVYHYITGKMKKFAVVIEFHNQMYLDRINEKLEELKCEH